MFGWVEIWKDNGRRNMRVIHAVMQEWTDGQTDDGNESSGGM